MNEYQYYKSYTDRKEVLLIQKKLQEISIETFIQRNIYSNKESYDLLIPSLQFHFIDKLLMESHKEKIPKDHYLNEFTDEELMEIVNQPEEWSAVDYDLSQKILMHRNIEFHSNQKEIADSSDTFLEKQGTYLVLLLIILMIIGFFFG